MGFPFVFFYNAPVLCGNRTTIPDRRKKLPICLGVVLLGFLAGVLFSFLLFPSVSKTYEAVLDPDRYGLLGQNILAGNGLVFKPEDGPTVFRGPLYPAFIALSLFLTDGLYPGGVWLGQSLLHGLTALLVFLMALKLWHRRVAVTAALLYALYPAVLWQVPRMWNETLLAFLAAGLVYLGLVYIKKPSRLTAAGIGGVLALLTLTKAIFLPFLILFPLVLILDRPSRVIKDALLIVLTAAIFISPWTVRNWHLSGRFIPVHVGMGGNLKRGNLMAREFFRHPLSYQDLFQRTNPEMDRIKRSVSGAQHEREIGVDRLMQASATQDIRRDPSLIVKKAIAAGAMFWFMGDTPTKTLVLVILRLPIILLFALAAFEGLRAGRKEIRPAVFLVVFFWILNMPFAPSARLSVPLLPILILVASTEISRLVFFRRPFECPSGT
jgi:4-amino-4-deoxy-L-arabinose transferase-like glycosyltransferase